MVFEILFGHVHTAAEYGCKSCIWVLNTVAFTHSYVIIQLHSVTKLMIQMLFKFKSCFRLMKIWLKNPRLDWTLVVLKRAVLCKSPSLILLWSLSLWLLVRNTGLTPIVRSYRQNSKHNCRLLCERDISRLCRENVVVNPKNICLFWQVCCCDLFHQRRFKMYFSVKTTSLDTIDVVELIIIHVGHWQCCQIGWTISCPKAH